MDTQLLREVSRSFSLSLRLLPGPMRWPVSLAYLLARASDTLADTESLPVEERMLWLEGFIREIDGGGAAWRGELGRFSECQSHAGERRLMERLDECFVALERLPEGEQAIVREVIRVITGGQVLDLERLMAGTLGMEDAASLEDYCYRVAGSVGAFWTRIGFETLGEGFSRQDAEELERAGIAYGKGLQLVNILRDLPGDLTGGRCYLPVAEPNDRQLLMAEAARWRETSRQWLDRGKWYSSQLRLRRLRAASVLPALLGAKTLDLLEHADWAQLVGGVKVTRGVVRRCLLRSLFW